ncbi:MAG TPA: ribonuclease HI family protein [Syntrophorhabdaceae bacterium]|jgi:ribonuclease HI
MSEWHVYIDGACSGNPGESGAGVIAFNGDGNELYRTSIYLGQMTNNMAEYEALIHALEKAKESMVKRVHVYTDSLLLANQINGIYKIHNACLQEYANKARIIMRLFDSFSVKHIPREENRMADKLAKKGVQKKG